MVFKGNWLVTLLLAFLHKGAAQLFVGDSKAPGILYAPLPDVGDDTAKIFDANFTFIPVSDGSIFNDLAYDPKTRTIFWSDYGGNKISRIQVDGSDERVIISRGKDRNPLFLAIDNFRRKVYCTVSDGTVIRANFDGSSVEIIYTYPDNSGIPYGILVNRVDGYVIWSSDYPGDVIKTGLNGSNPENLLNTSRVLGIATEQCTGDTTLLYYIEEQNTLGVKNLKSGQETTLHAYSFRRASSRLSKYGTKLYWSEGDPPDKRVIYQYDLRTSVTTIHDGVLTLTNGSSYSTTPDITIVSSVATYTEPVAVLNCPDDIIVTLDDNATSTTVSISWTEPKLRGWSGCHSMEFRGDGSNGGTFTVGTTDLSYVASDVHGNTDECRFSVTVRRASGMAEVTTSDPGTGSAFIISSAVWTVSTALLIFCVLVST